MWFLRDCASAGPTACALALETDVDPEGSEIEQRLEAYLNGLWEAPRAIVTSEGQAGVLTSSIARGGSLSPSKHSVLTLNDLAASFAISIQRACTNRPTDPNLGLRLRLSLRLPSSTTTRCLSTSTSPGPSSSAPPRASSHASPSGARTRLPRQRGRASAQRKRPRR